MSAVPAEVMLDREPSSRLRYLPWLITALMVLVFFHETALAMAAIWWRSDTYAHAFLVAPISAWLVWRRREAWLGIPVRASAPWLVPVAGACLLWLVGQLASVNAASQFAVVAMIVCSVPATLGWAMTRQILFPLLFLFFSVPVGEFLTDTMIAGTADFTVAALSASGIPVYREGMQFVIPSGNWSVVEACSGVRYLIASFMVGTLFAYLNFSSWRRRLAFMVVSLLTPVVANWLRAYLIVMLGHLSGNKLAVGADHLIYGWVFFGMVIMIIFWIGSRFSQTEVISAPGQAAMQPGTGAGLLGWAAALAIGALLVGTQALQWRLEHARDGGTPVIELPNELAGGWRADDAPLSAWVPAFHNASATASRTYKAGGEAVAVWVGLYRNQGNDRKLVTSANRLVEAESLVWAHLEPGIRSVSLGTQAQDMRSALLRTPASPNSMPVQRLNVLHFYRVGTQLTISDVRAKIELALARLLGRSDESAVIIFYSAADGDDDKSRRKLEAWVGQYGAGIVAALDRSTARP